jgi:hypothetical protein
MATSVSLGFCVWLAGETWNDSVGRNQLNAALTYLAYTQGGVLMNNGNPLACAPSSGLSFTTTAGAAVIPSAVGDGAYIAQNNTTQTLTCQTADPTNPRIDIVVINVTDNGNNTSFAQLEIVTGTPAASPSAPATPTDSVLLYQIAVAANQTTLVSGNFTDVRVWTAAPGGIVRCPNMSSLPAGGPGVVGYDVVNNRLFFLTATGAQPLSVQNYPPALAQGTTNVPYSADAETTVLSVNFNSDGSDVLIVGRWGDSYSSAATSQLGQRIYIDSVLWQGNSCYSNYGASSDGHYHHGNQTVTLETSSLTGNTPSPGVHTAKLTVIDTANSGVIQGSTGGPIQLGVSVIYT